MFAQFQSLYPQGSLISELVQIDHGKYIVRASVQIEGITRATGMAAAETLEEAEDRARSRALMVLGITSTTQGSAASSLKPTMQIKPNPTLVTTSGLSESSAYSTAIDSFPQTEATAFTSTSNANTQDLAQRFPVSQPTEATAFTPTSNVSTQDLAQRFPVSQPTEAQLDTLGEDLGIMSLNQFEHNPLPEISASNVTPFAPRSYTSQQDVGTPTTKKNKKSEPVDHSDTIAKIDVEMQRLGWTTEQGRDHLKTTYGKRARSLLDPEELLDFLKHLESQTTPVDPLAGF